MDEKLCQINPINEMVLKYYRIMRNKDLKSSFMIFVHLKKELWILKSAYVKVEIPIKQNHKCLGDF